MPLVTTVDPFTVYSSKALDVTRVLADGDLLLEGWAARWAVDREDEAFMPDSFGWPATHCGLPRSVNSLRCWRARRPVRATVCCRCGGVRPAAGADAR